MKTQMAQTMADTFSAHALDQIATACEDYESQLKTAWQAARAEKGATHYSDSLWQDMDTFRRTASCLREIGGYRRPTPAAATKRKGRK